MIRIPDIYFFSAKFPFLWILNSVCIEKFNFMAGINTFYLFRFLFRIAKMLFVLLGIYLSTSIYEKSTFLANCLHARTHSHHIHFITYISELSEPWLQTFSCQLQLIFRVAIFQYKDVIPAKNRNFERTSSIIDS